MVWLQLKQNHDVRGDTYSILVSKQNKFIWSVHVGFMQRQTKLRYSPCSVGHENITKVIQLLIILPRSP